MDSGQAPSHSCQGKVTVSHLEDIITGALVRREGLQIYLELQHDSRRRIVGLAAKAALTHPEVGALCHSTFAPIVESLGLARLVFLRSIARVAVLQQGIRRDGRRVPCSIPVPSEVLLDATLLQRLGGGLAASDQSSPRMRLCIFGPLSERMLDGIGAARASGFDVAIRVDALEAFLGLRVMQEFQGHVIVSRARVVAAKASSEAMARLRSRLCEVAAMGGQVIATGIGSKQSLLDAAALGIKVLQGNYVAVPADIARALSAANAHL